MPVPNTFAADTSQIPLSDLDANFTYYDNAYNISGTVMTVNYTLTTTNPTATIGTSTAASTYGIGTGENATGITKTINIGSSGASGSITNINIGSSVAGATGTTTINSLNTIVSGLETSAPKTINAATYTQLIEDYSLIITTTAPTITLLSAAAYAGKILLIKNITATAVISASANVVPLASATAGNAILAATAGKFAMLQSNGTSWVIMLAN